MRRAVTILLAFALLSVAPRSASAVTGLTVWSPCAWDTVTYVYLIDGDATLPKLDLSLNGGETWPSRDVTFPADQLPWEADIYRSMATTLTVRYSDAQSIVSNTAVGTPEKCDPNGTGLPSPTPAPTVAPTVAPTPKPTVVAVRSTQAPAPSTARKAVQTVAITPAPSTCGQ